MSEGWNIAVLGATGAVGEALLETLAERQFPVGEIFALARNESAGEHLRFGGKSVIVKDAAEFDWTQAQLAFFAAGAEASAAYIEDATNAGCLVIDLSGLFALEPDVPLVVPDVNPFVLGDYRNRNLIAVPNSLTSQLLTALKPLIDQGGLSRISVTNLLSASGQGKKAVDALAGQSAKLLNGIPIDEDDFFGRQLAFNMLPLLPDREGSVREERRIVDEARKILQDDGLMISANVVQSPVFYGHAQMVNFEAMRPLAAALCLGSNDIVLTGEPRMKERPIGHLVDALRQGGAQIDYLEQENYPPLRLRGGFQGGNVEVDGSVSSQFLTALLMTAPLAPQDTVIAIKGDLVSKPYIDITLHLMKTFGVEVDNQSYQRFVVRGKQQYQSPGDYLVEGDASSASYFLAAGAIKGGTVKVTGIGRGSVQGDIRFADVLEKMGATVTWGDDFIACTRGELKAIDMDMNHIPDAAMTIATAALFAQGTTTLRNIYNWRVKETDRLFAMATELRKVGAEVEEGEDYIRIPPPAKLKYAEIGTYNDHRMAMCFSLVALSDTPVIILDPKCTAKTFPDYFEQLARISTLA